MRARRGHRRVVMLLVGTAMVLGLFGAPVAEAAARPKPSGSDTGCSRKNPCEDTAAPVVTIADPTGGSAVTTSFTVSGTAADDRTVAAVDVRVGDGPWTRASGTTSWSQTLQATAGVTTTVTARATDGAGKVTTSSVTVSVQSSADTTAPAVAITAPAAGSTVSGTVAVTGTASDGGSVAAVDVRVDAGAWTRAAGTSSWSTTVDTGALAAGSHTVTARATDAAGNTGTASVTFTVATASTPGDTIVTDPAAQHDLVPIGRTRLPQWGSATGVLYSEQFTNRKVVFFRDAVSGATSAATLPADSLYGWHDVGSVMTSANDLWVLGGTGPLHLRHYRLSGSPLPTSATLVSNTTFGNSDSRPGDLLRLESGALVAVWHQQGIGGPEGLRVGYRSTGGSWSYVDPAIWVTTGSSNQVLAQHPADGSVWVFHDADTAGRIGAAQLVESGGALQVVRQTPDFITSTTHGSDGPDPENAFLAAAAHPASGTLRLAYQSADRRWVWQGDRFMIESTVAVAAISTSGAVTVERTPVRAERVSPIGLVAAGSDLLVSYFPVDAQTLTADRIAVVRRSAGGWGSPTVLGTETSQVRRVTYATGRAEFSARLADGKIHLRQL